MPQVMFATPAYDGKMTAEYVSSLAQSRNFLAEHGVASCHVVQANDLIERARNSLLADFLASECTHLFFIDSDQSWDPRAPYVCVTLDKPFLCAISPPRKDDPDKWPGRFLEPFHTDERGMIEMEYCGFGFVCLSREMVETMVAAYPDDWIYDEFKDNRKIPWLFDTSRVDHYYFSEDVTFCKKWRAVGGQIWCLSGVVMGHTGPKTWRGNYREFLNGGCTRPDNAGA